MSAAGSAAQRACEDDHSPVAILARRPGGEDRAEDWPDSREARLNGGASRAPFLAALESGDGKLKARDRRNAEHAEIAGGAEERSAIRNLSRRSSLKKPNRKQTLDGWPPTPRGCEWRRSDGGLNLWRCWTEWDGEKNKRIKKSRYAGHLSDDAWRIMKEYDHEAFISIVGEGLRRHGGR